LVVNALNLLRSFGRFHGRVFLIPIPLFLQNATIIFIIFIINIINYIYIDMNIIKINHLEKDIIKKIYVFKGLFDVTDDYLINGDKIFSENEMENIINKNIPIELISELIHYDDTISTIKKKIIKHTKIRISTYEL
jgi:hypothetical protein